MKTEDFRPGEILSRFRGSVHLSPERDACYDLLIALGILLQSEQSVEAGAFKGSRSEESEGIAYRIHDAKGRILFAALCSPKAQVTFLKARRGNWREEFLALAKAQRAEIPGSGAND